MQEDLRTLSDQITALTNRFVEEAVRLARNGKSPAFISLIDVAPETFSEKQIERYIGIIQAELTLRPEIKTAHLPQSIADFSERKAFEPLVLVTEVEESYLKGKEPETHISLRRLAEVGERAIEYVQEEAEDVFQDLTERLGLSMKEVSLLDPSYRFLSQSSQDKQLERLTSKIADARQRSESNPSEPVEHLEPAYV